MRYFKIFMVLVILAIGALFLLNYQSNDMQKEIYDKDSAINEEGDSYRYRHYDQSSSNHALDLKFGAFYGCDTFYRVNAAKPGTVTIDYDAKVEKGRFKIVMILPERKVTKISEGSGKGQKTMKLEAEEYRIKIVGDNATGTIKMSVSPDDGITAVLEGDDFLSR